MATRNANLKEREESTEAEASGEEKRSWPKEREKAQPMLSFVPEQFLSLSCN